MKKFLTVLVSVLLIFALAGCSEQAELPTTPEETPPIADASPEPVAQANPTPTNTEAGIIFGDVFYKDIPISRLFLEPFIDVLGEPISQQGAFFHFEGLSIVGLLSSAADEEEWTEYDNVAIQLNALESRLYLFILNGVSLEMTRAELIDAFGAPYHDIVEHDHSLMYRVSTPTIEYTVRFWFERPDDDMPIFSISMFRTAE